MHSVWFHSFQPGFFKISTPVFLSLHIQIRNIAHAGVYGSDSRPFLFSARTCFGWLERSGKKRSQHPEIRECKESVDYR